MTSGRPTADACASYVLDVSLLNRARLKLGVYGSAPIMFNDGFEISLTIDTRSEHYYWFLTLAHAKRNVDGGPVRYQV
jgi:hypothetical protein